MSEESMGNMNLGTVLRTYDTDLGKRTEIIECIVTPQTGTQDVIAKIIKHEIGGSYCTIGSFDDRAEAVRFLRLTEYNERLREENRTLVLSVLNQQGDNLCHLSGVPTQIPPQGEFLESCRRYHAQMLAQNGELNAGQMTIAQLEAELAEYKSIFDLQQKRMGEATKRWQAATGRYDALPDLGDLLQWLMDQGDKR